MTLPCNRRGKFLADIKMGTSLCEVVPVSQILFGTDYPYRGSEEHVNGLHACGFEAIEAMAAGLFKTPLLPR